MEKVTCPGCGAAYPRMDGATHAYLTVSSECWARFGRSLDLHYSDHRYWPAHQPLTDAYALQHSRGEDPRAVRSRNVHLAALYAHYVLGQPEARVISLRRTLAAADVTVDIPDWPDTSVSIDDVALSNPEDHIVSVDRFARAVLEDWEAYHDEAERLCRV